MDVDIEVQKRFISEFYNYYLELEERLKELAPYIAFEANNSSAYSNALLSLLQSVGSEIDVCGKAIAESYEADVNFDGAGITKWGYYVQRAFPEINGDRLLTPLDTIYRPWAKWKIETFFDKKNTKRYRYVKSESAESPDWWKAYNSVKHGRKNLKEPGKSNYHRANLKNVIHALGGLYVMECNFIEQFDDDIRMQIQPSSIFTMLTV